MVRRLRSMPAASGCVCSSGAEMDLFRGIRFRISSVSFTVSRLEGRDAIGFCCFLFLVSWVNLGYMVAVKKNPVRPRQDESRLGLPGRSFAVRHGGWRVLDGRREY